MPSSRRPFLFSGRARRAGFHLAWVFGSSCRGARNKRVKLRVKGRSRLPTGCWEQTTEEPVFRRIQGRRGVLTGGVLVVRSSLRSASACASSASRSSLRSASILRPAGGLRQLGLTILPSVGSACASSASGSKRPEDDEDGEKGPSAARRPEESTLVVRGCQVGENEHWALSSPGSLWNTICYHIARQERVLSVRLRGDSSDEASSTGEGNYGKDGNPEPRW